MGNNTPFTPPEITDVDIEWVTKILDLPEKAFLGEDGTDRRGEVLKDMSSYDVSACPGSGKTTLLVAKLAILANKWNYRTNGICVLSHTNAARDEIENRLGSTSVGRQLLTYPHYIGTIHGFINQFFALPWLRSKGYKIKMVDTNICQARRWYSLPHATRNALEKNYYSPSVLSIKSPDFNLGSLKWGRGFLGSTTTTYAMMQKACKLSTEQGYFCYDEMFMWAKELMEKNPKSLGIIRSRFPMLFIDETQDNSEVQSEILSQIFIANGRPVIRQRFGDENQAIFDFVGAKEASIDKFPSEEKKKELPESHRFCENIARLAEPLGLSSIKNTCTLIGQGPKCRDISPIQEANQHTIFLFDDNTMTEVLDAYGQLLLNIFPNDSLRKGVFTSIGQVHRGDADANKPRHIKHYWPDYDPELCSKEPRPSSFMQYVYSGIGISQKTGDTHPAVEKIGEGLLRLVGMAENLTILQRRGYCHRHIMRVLEEHPKTAHEYLNLVHGLAVKINLPTQEIWQNTMSKLIREIATLIAGDSLQNTGADHFLKWQKIETEPMPVQEGVKCRDNMYCYSSDGKEVSISVGSIHSVKGETHTATLVLETFWHNHNLESILEWVCANNFGCGKTGVRNINRLKIHYVAMTRPSHLLCLAMKKSNFEDDNGQVKSELYDKLVERGWDIKIV